MQGFHIHHMRTISKVGSNIDYTFLPAFIIEMVQRSKHFKKGGGAHMTIDELEECLLASDVEIEGRERYNENRRA